jgi:hypothetical protein
VFQQVYNAHWLGSFPPVFHGNFRRDILQRILATKVDKVQQARARMPLREVEAAARSAPLPRDFTGALRARIPAAPAVSEDESSQMSKP